MYPYDQQQFSGNQMRPQGPLQGQQAPLVAPLGYQRPQFQRPMPPQGMPGAPPPRMPGMPPQGFQRPMMPPQGMGGPGFGGPRPMVMNGPGFSGGRAPQDVALRGPAAISYPDGMPPQGVPPQGGGWQRPGGWNGQRPGGQGGALRQVLGLPQNFTGPQLQTALQGLLGMGPQTPPVAPARTDVVFPY